MLKITAIGNVTRDNELREVNGTKVLNFSIARNDRRTKQVTYIECTLWGALAVMDEGQQQMAQYQKPETQNHQQQDLDDEIPF